MKLVRESIYNFHKTGDIKSSLGIGRVAAIRELFRNLGIPDEAYRITDTEVVFKGNLNLYETNIKELPEGLIVEGDLNLRRASIDKLPKKIYVKGRLSLINCSIKELPEDLIIGGDLALGGSSIKSLPKGLNVGGSLFLNGASSIFELPEDLKVGKFIYIYISQRIIKAYIKSSKFANKLKVWRN